MRSEFEKFIAENQLFDSSRSYLLAMSGGVDSMVLGALLLRAGVKIAVAHCNFKLRGESSDADEQLVVNWAQKNQVPCYVKTFRLQSLGEKSIQEEARNMRYQWFFELLELHQLSAIITAHHASDNFETLIINLLRGSGAYGWSGVPLNENKIIRPLLFASKVQIEQYAEQNKIDFREDESNASDDYLRNKIRHGLAREFRALDAHIEQRVSENQMQLRQSLKMTQTLIDLQNATAIEEREDVLEINLAQLKPEDFATDVLYFKLREKGFNYTQCQQAAVANHSGKIWYSNSHQMLFDRGHLLIKKYSGAPSPTNSSAKIWSDTVQVSAPLSLTFERQSGGDVVLSSNPNTALLDVETLVFPLVLRKWREGDRFVPLGMTGSKLVSDFLTDQKVDLFRKESVCVLESAGEIVWVVGFRIAHPCRVTSSTQEVLKIVLQP